MVKKTVSIVIPNYNGANLLAKNLPKVLEAAYYYDKNTEIIVVDDGSTDNSLDILKSIIGEFRHSGEEQNDDSRIHSSSSGQVRFWTSQNDERIKIVLKEKNEGFSSTCNLGVANAKGKVVVLLNSDVWPEKNFLEFIVPHFENADIFGVGSLDKSWEDGKEIDRGRGIGEFKQGFLVHARGETNQTNTLWVSGGSSAYNKKIWQELGGFDENFNPFYWEDIDLSYRAQKQGYEIIFEPKAVVHHNHEEGAIKNKYTNTQIKTIAYRNQLLFMWKNITDKDLIKEHLINLPTLIVKSLVRKDFPFIIGLTMAILKLPRLFFNRTTVHCSKTRSISDKEILIDYKNEF